MLVNYPVVFGCSKSGWRWIVWSVYPDNIPHTVAGPFWRWQTAYKLRDLLTQHYRNGYDMRARQQASAGEK